MNKKIMALIVLLLLIPSFKTYALEDSFYEGEYIKGEYIKKFRGSSGKYEQLRFFRRKSDNKIVYCIELWEVLSSNKMITGYDNNQYDYAKIDYSVWERIMLISYYGYGYQNHTESKWYAITQYMIWKETSPDTNIYFTDTLNGKRIEKYQQEMDEINILIQNHANVSSFYDHTYQVKYKVPTTIEDTNNELNSFEITDAKGIQVSKNGNTLTFIKDYIGNSPIILANMGKLYETPPIVYIDDEGQNVLAPGNYYPIYMTVNVNLPAANIIVNNLDMDTQNNITQGDSKLSGAKVQLLDKDHQLISEKIIKEDGTITFEDIGYGTYYIKKIESSEGYLLNQEIITLEVDNNIEIVNLYNRVIKNKIVLENYLKNPVTGDIKIGKGTTFSIYNSKNQKINSITTDDNGITQIVLPYGTYIIKQEYSIKNHDCIDNFEIRITEDNLIQTFKLYNEELTAKIKVASIDADSKLPILEKGASFKIKNLDTDKYLLDEEGKIRVLTTDNLGNTEFVTVTSGTYQLEQIKAVDGYLINTNTFNLEISDESNFTIDENNNKYIEVKIPNIKQKAQIEIDKYTEYYLNDDLIKTEKEMDITIPIYAKEDIYSKDGIKLYEQDEQVGSAVLNDEKVITSLLDFGKYYIKNTTDDTIIEIVLNKLETQKIKLLDKVYKYEEELPKVTISENTNSDNINEEIEIIVPNTLTNQSFFSNLNLLLIGIGLLIIRKSKKHEDN